MWAGAQPGSSKSQIAPGPTQGSQPASAFHLAIESQVPPQTYTLFSFFTVTAISLILLTACQEQKLSEPLMLQAGEEDANLSASP